MNETKRRCELPYWEAFSDPLYFRSAVVFQARNVVLILSEFGKYAQIYPRCIVNSPGAMHA